MPIPPTIELHPPTSWDEFEKLIAELCTREWRTSLVSRYGRQGQATQQGVDIFGYPNDDKTKLTCVQYSFLWLDGARYLLPLPPAPANEERVVDAMQAALGRIVGQGVMCSFDEGMQRAKIRIVPVHHDSQREWLRE